MERDLQDLRDFQEKTGAGFAGFAGFSREDRSRICRIYTICRISQEHFSGSGEPELQGWARCLFGLWRARAIENGVSISFGWGGVFDCPGHGGGQAPALRWNCAVSIPLHRAGVSVSLPVGKDRQILTVSIPFKRDGVSEPVACRWPAPLCCHVSIPFKREGVSEPRMSLRWHPSVSCFYSLQAGRRF